MTQKPKKICETTLKHKKMIEITKKPKTMTKNTPQHLKMAKIHSKPFKTTRRPYKQKNNLMILKPKKLLK